MNLNKIPKDQRLKNNFIKIGLQVLGEIPICD